MIFGLGSDIVQITRIEALYKEYGDKFVKRILTSEEEKNFRQIKPEIKQISYLAKRFAGKEALAKALGTGISSGINFADIEILNDSSGKPIVNLYGKAYDIFSKTPGKIDISLSDDYPTAFAVVIISRG